MTRKAWKRDEPDSPCLQVCVIHPTAGICIGCHRTAEEVRRWAQFTPDQRQELLLELPGRDRLLKTRRGGRKKRVARTADKLSEPLP